MKKIVLPLASVDHTRFEELQKEFATPQEVTEACIACHNERHKEVMAPLLVVTGLLYMFHRSIDANDMVLISDIPLEWVAWLHTLGACLQLSRTAPSAESS